MCLLFFFFNDTATTDIYTLSLHDALPIYKFHGLTLANFRDEGLVPGFRMRTSNHRTPDSRIPVEAVRETTPIGSQRSEEHTSELQSHSDLVCRLLLEKKKESNNRTCTTDI